MGLGVIDVLDPAVETAQTAATRIRRALELVPAERLVVNPDCGLRNLRAATARAKLAAMVAGAALVRDSLPSPDPTPPTTSALTPPRDHAVASGA